MSSIEMEKMWVRSFPLFKGKQIRRRGVKGRMICLSETDVNSKGECDIKTARRASSEHQLLVYFCFSKPYEL
jgi:hypothetical protein